MKKIIFLAPLILMYCTEKEQPETAFITSKNNSEPIENYTSEEKKISISKELMNENDNETKIFAHLNTVPENIKKAVNDYLNENKLKNYFITSCTHENNLYYVSIHKKPQELGDHFMIVFDEELKIVRIHLGR